MVICSECGTRINPKISSCPKCGAAVDATDLGPPVRPRPPAKPRRTIAAAVVAAALAALGAYFFLR